MPAKHVDGDSTRLHQQQGGFGQDYGTAHDGARVAPLTKQEHLRERVCPSNAVNPSLGSGTALLASTVGMGGASRRSGRGLSAGKMPTVRDHRSRKYACALLTRYDCPSGHAMRDQDGYNLTPSIHVPR